MIRTMLYVGSFNPVHIGHTAIANFAIAEGLADEFWFVVSPHNPLKPSNELAPQEHRLEMVRVAISGAGLESVAQACDVEFSMPRPSFTIDTLEKLKIDHPEREFSIVMGGDNFADITKWKNYQKILAEHNIYIYPRAGAILAEDLISLPNVFIISDAPLLDISATQLRDFIAQGKFIPALMPAGVYKYIINNNLYTNDDTNR